MLKQTLLLLLFLCTCASTPLSVKANSIGSGQLFANDTEPDEPSIRKISVVNHLGREHFRIKTAKATYFYDPVAGGFSSIFDKLGNDWVSYNDDEAPEYPAAAATKYRGLPNLVYGGDDDGVGHPGHQKCESRVVGRNRIHTVSLSGEWAWTWTFYSNAAKLEVEKAPDDQPYWFLYEGPAGGKYQPRSTFWATDLTDPSYVIHDHFANKIYRAQHRYMYFGEDHVPYVFFMMQTTPDTKPDHISYLGNEEIGARDSPDGMIVAGFGRAENATPLLTGPNTFIIGLTRYNAKDPLSIGRTRQRLEKLARKRSRSSKLLIP
ncbi:hypothetical protein [Neolewinella persica]|uniref:hypothetical protein n=1 Tax=Neolewinella persica TaxID=70998 RepID=UPI000374CE4B|nr:hypothetical protein [Neolewinella persica]